jgi:SpoVK/Ycf46/Vps4 family AAA+-type ATPase
MNIIDLITQDKEQVLFDDIILENQNKSLFQQLIKEHEYIDALHQYQLPVNNKILLQGASGCGKTMTAKALAKSLGKPILILNLSNVICSRIGETSQNIRQVFEKAARENAVLFLDEFDQIGKARGNDDKDVGEMRRLVNTLIQLIDYFPEKALLLCATNHPEIIDTALLRRFQLKVTYSLPSDTVLDSYYDKLLSRFPSHMHQIERLYGVSFAEAKDYAFTLLKHKVIEELDAQRTSTEIL